MSWRAVLQRTMTSSRGGSKGMPCELNGRMQPGEVTHVLAQADALAAASDLQGATRLLSELLASDKVEYID